VKENIKQYHEFMSKEAFIGGLSVVARALIAGAGMGAKGAEVVLPVVLGGSALVGGMGGLALSKITAPGSTGVNLHKKEYLRSRLRFEVERAKRELEEAETEKAAIPANKSIRIS